MSTPVSRRDFIAATASTAALSIMNLSTAQGANANSKVKVGVIGLGGRGAWIANMVKNHGGYQITAVADYFENTAKRVGQKLGVPADHCFSGLSGYKKVIDSGVDALFLETPPCFFPEHAKAAVDAGCHVFVAKPVACDVPGVMSMKASGERATKNKKVFLVDFQTRTEPLIIEGISKLHEGSIGKIGLINSYYADEGFSDPPKGKTIENRLKSLIWTNDVELGGGMLVNAGIHMVDLGLWMNEDKVPVSAMGVSEVVRKNPNGNTAYVYSLTYEFDNGVTMNHRGDHLKNRTGFSTKCVALCQTGHFQSGYGGLTRILGLRSGWRGGEVTKLYGNGAKRNIDKFHKSIAAGIHDNPTLAPSINSTLATILGREAGKRKTKLTMKELLKENKALKVDLRGLKA